MCSCVSMSGCCLSQRQYFVSIHSGVPVVHHCGQPRTSAHSILICQDVTISRQEGKETAGQSLDGKREMTPDCHCRCAQSCEKAHTYMHLHKNTHKACQSVDQSMSTWGTRLLPFVSPQTSQHSSLTCTTVGSSSYPLIVTDDDTVHVVRFNMFNFKWYCSAALHFSFYFMVMDIECEFWIPKKKKKKCQCCCCQLGGLW